MAELTPAERREIFLSLAPLLSAAIEQTNLLIALRDAAGDEAQAARVEATEKLELYDAEIERRFRLLGKPARGSN